MNEIYLKALQISLQMNDPTYAWNAAVEAAAAIAEESHDDWDKSNPYCEGVCDASTGIAMRIKSLKI